ncbi:MAG: hypothetical protein WCV93_04390 [Candidatus Shapirobacteria bacterium]|jgi:hypothetical protein
MLALGSGKRFPDSLVYCRPGNRRTGIVTSSSGIQLAGVPLRYLDEKGLGQLSERRIETGLIRQEYVRTCPPKAGKLHGRPITWGITDLETARYDVESTHGLVQDGLRIIPTVAIVPLTKILDETGNYLAIKDAVENGLLAAGSIPAIQFRAYVTPYRPGEFIFTKLHNLSQGEINRRKIMFLEGMADMSLDPSIPIDFSNPEKSILEYLDWFATTFGGSLARLHRAKKHTAILTNFTTSP